MPSSPLRVALLCSARAPGLDFLIERTPHRGTPYEIVCCLSSHADSEAESESRRAGIPFLVHSIHDFYRSSGKGLGDLELRRAFDTETVTLLRPFRPDAIVLSSYLYILTEPMLSFFFRRILNVHHSDLTLRNGDGSPRYAGLRSVRDAVLAGETETRATVHVATETLDDGPLFLRSWSFPISPLTRDALAWGATHVLKAYAYAHQEWMLRSAWGPLIAKSVELLASGRAHFSDRAVWLDGVPGPFDLEQIKVSSGQEDYRVTQPPRAASSDTFTRTPWALEGIS